MKSRPNPLMTACLFACICFSFSIRAQNESRYELLLRSGRITPASNINKESLITFNQSAKAVDGKLFVILQFEETPTETEHRLLQRAGITLLDYIPNHAYTATVPSVLDEHLLQQVKARAIIKVSPAQKIQSSLAGGEYPSWAVRTPGTIDVWISYARSFSFDTVEAALRKMNFDVQSYQYKDYRIIPLRIATMRLNELAELPFIEYVQAAPKEDHPLNDNSMFLSRSNILRAPILSGGYGLDGEGVVVGVGDNGDIQSHIDFTGRTINRAAHIMRGHAAHVSGTIGGAGIINERWQGYAPKATLVSQLNSNILLFAPTYVQDYGMVITNNSYGSVEGDCFYAGLYDLTSRVIDQQAFDFPELQHVFAGGNDGLTPACTPYAPGFRTVLGGYQSAKNSITVGSTDLRGNVSPFSSKGPVRDGRLKPEIMSQGALVISTWVFNAYSSNNGTSMAAPGVSGGLALLIQRYRQLHGNANPNNALAKALLLNGGNDHGNAGPDYSYGFGSMNMQRSVIMLENNRYFNGTLTPVGNTSSHTITVPANMHQLKILLYWQDPPAAVMASKTLVNDLDMQVVTPGSTTVLPNILDATPAGVNVAAIRGVDHTNNVEQVTIDNPAAGTYTVNIAGAINQNPSQNYYLVYDFIPPGLVLTNPLGGEAFVPSITPIDSLHLQWESNGGPDSTFLIEFTKNDGVSWDTLVRYAPANSRVFTWGVPMNTATDLARIRITKNGTGLTHSSGLFVIDTVAALSLTASVQCEGYIRLDWSAVNGATDYEVMMLRGKAMVSVATTNSLQYTFSGLSKDSTYWVTVRPRINGKPGRRAPALSRQPNNGLCTGSISDNDLKIDSLVTRLTGRKFTSTEFTTATTISVRVKNLDDQPAAGGFVMKYSINGGGWNIDTVSATINPGNTYVHDFSQQQNFSVTGNYQLRISVENLVADPVTQNDTLTTTIRQMDNAPIDLTTTFTDNVEGAVFTDVTENKSGLEGDDRYDFSRSTRYGRIRSFVNSGIAYSGSKAFSMDATENYDPTNTNYLYGTFNIGAYTVSANNLRLDFQFKNHGQESNANNKVWVRGDDLSPWLEAYDLNVNQTLPGIYKRSASIDITRILSAGSQNFTSSFQVRWGQNGIKQLTDNFGGTGYSFDDIRLYQVFNDMEMVSVDSPNVYSCGLNNTVPIKITVKNTTAAAVTSVPVKYSIDGGPFITPEFISSIAGNATVQYTFTTPANLSSAGTHTVVAVVSYVGDSYTGNDTVRFNLVNLPYITSFPYLENFEAGDGSWYTVSAKRSSWQYGTPVSPRIARAASGAKAWKTSLNGYYNDDELSYLYSPCFDISGMTNPTLSFSLALDIEDCGAVLCDAAWVEYSSDGGSTWSKLGATGSGTNWYNRNYGGNHVWSQQNYTRWHVATHALPTGISKLRLRFVFDSDEGLNKDGIAIDDIHIYNNNMGIYDGVTMGSPVTQVIPVGTNWVDITSGGKLVASIQPNNQDLGNTEIQAYIHAGAARNYNRQYYHNRNITIKPQAGFETLADSAIVRFYFLDTETELLLAASGCPTCTKPVSAYDLGVSKYSSPNNALEDGNVTNSTGNYWTFINSINAAKVPFDKGYYAEFKVKDFSEFWLNNGGFDNNTSLPVSLTSFTAVKASNGVDVTVAWRTATETDVDRFEIEVAKGNDELRQNHFTKIGEKPSMGNSTTEQAYQFIDQASDKSGVRYYRLKTIDKNGSISYSAVRPVIFNGDITWQVFPNPSAGQFNVLLQAADGERISLRVYDAGGKLVYQLAQPANGYLQKINMDMGSKLYAPGLYLLEAQAGDRKEQFRLLKK